MYHHSHDEECQCGGLVEATYSAAVEELAGEMEEQRVVVALIHKLRCGLSWNAISAHVEAGHSQDPAVVLDFGKCAEQDCVEAREAVAEADAWLEPRRDWLDIKPLEPAP